MGWIVSLFLIYSFVYVFVVSLMMIGIVGWLFFGDLSLMISIFWYGVNAWIYLICEIKLINFLLSMFGWFWLVLLLWNSENPLSSGCWDISQLLEKIVKENSNENTSEKLLEKKKNL